MSLRVTTNQAKTSYVVASYVVAVLVLFGVGLTAGLVAASVVWGIMLLATVGVAVRTFRGDDESLTAPRAWYRMSARPTSGFVFAAVFLLQGGVSCPVICTGRACRGLSRSRCTQPRHWCPIREFIDQGHENPHRACIEK